MSSDLDDAEGDVEPSAGLPTDVVRSLNGLSGRQLRLAIEYAEERLEDGPRIPTDVRVADGSEDVLRTENRGTHKVVVARHACEDGCEDCPHGPYRYHVRRTSRPDGSEERQWRYAGRVSE